MSKPLILIVEDDDATAEFLTDLLSTEGYDTQTLRTPHEAEAVRALWPDLVLLDLVPNDAGTEKLLHDLQREGEFTAPPIVLLSAAPRLAEAASRLPVQGCLSKPFDLDLLLQTVANLLGSRRSVGPQRSAQLPQTGLAPGV
mgnify:CR=1 FL=1